MAESILDQKVEYRDRQGSHNLGHTSTVETDSQQLDQRRPDDRCSATIAQHLHHWCHSVLAISRTNLACHSRWPPVPKEAAATTVDDVAAAVAEPCDVAAVVAVPNGAVVAFLLLLPNAVVT